ncbi:MAG: hypothetical protein R3D30_15625 [Hyphomicrobiales bacterium]
MTPATHRAPATTKQEIGHQRRRGAVHPVAIEVGLAAAIWFIAVSWLSFAWDREVDINLAVVTLFFVIFFTLFLLTASHAIDDPRWPSKTESFVSFLRDDNIAIDRGTMKGRDVFIEVTLIPVALAFAATLIGLAWVIFG